MNLKLNPSNCKFGASDIALNRCCWNLPDPGMVATIPVFPIPTTPINMRAFLGLTSYYRNLSKVMLMWQDLCSS